MMYEVPFSSQYTDIGHHEWRARGCGIAALYMVMGYWHGTDTQCKLPTLQALLKTGRSLGAYRDGIGWSHTGLVKLAQTFGYTGFNADFAPNSPTPLDELGAWSQLSAALRDGPVLASVFAGLDPTRGGGHIVVVTGIHDDMVSFNDPEERTAREGLRSVAVGVFLASFKRRFIVIRPE